MRSILSILTTALALCACNGAEQRDINPSQPADAGVDTPSNNWEDDYDRDYDDDGVSNLIDNCYEVYNPQQTNTDHDLSGDACDEYTSDEESEASLSRDAYGHCVIEVPYELRDTNRVSAQYPNGEPLESGIVTAVIDCCTWDGDCNNSPNGPKCVPDLSLSQAMGGIMVNTCQPCIQGSPTEGDLGCGAGQECMWDLDSLFTDWETEQKLSWYGSFVGGPDQNHFWCEITDADLDGVHVSWDCNDNDPTKGSPPNGGTCENLSSSANPECTADADCPAIESHCLDRTNLFISYGSDGWCDNLGSCDYEGVNYPCDRGELPEPSCTNGIIQHAQPGTGYCDDHRTDLGAMCNWDFVFERCDYGCNAEGNGCLDYNPATETELMFKWENRHTSMCFDDQVRCQEIPFEVPQNYASATIELYCQDGQGENQFYNYWSNLDISANNELWFRTFIPRDLNVTKCYAILQAYCGHDYQLCWNATQRVRDDESNETIGTQVSGEITFWLNDVQADYPAMIRYRFEGYEDLAYLMDFSEVPLNL